MKESNILSNNIFIWQFLGKKRQWQLSGLLILMILAVFAEMVSLGAVVPFLAALTDPHSLMEKSWFNPIKDFFDIHSNGQIIFLLTLFFASAVILSTALKVFLSWISMRLSVSMKIQLQTEFFRCTLYQPYEHHIARNSSTLISLATQKINLTANVTLMESLRLIVAVCMSIGIITTLVYIDPYIAIVTFGVLGGSYFLSGIIVRNFLKRYSVIDAENHPLALKYIQESVGGIRDIIIDNSEEAFLQGYKKHISKSAIAGNMNVFLSQLPKSIIELMGILFIIVLAYNLSIQGKEALPILGALALGLQRLLPSLQQIYTAWSSIIGSQATISEVVTFLRKKNSFGDKQIHAPHFHNSIVLKNISFRYFNSQKNIIDNINLTIQKGERIGFIGSTGSGKSTLIDIIMGLLIPTQGKLLIDKMEINEHNRRGWQKCIAHVAQEIFLLDSSIKENIAFGITKEHIDFNKVKTAAQNAYLDEFINTLPNGYETKVGERGVQLSGGQRQRIGIARALYKEAKVIIFDEATSALDDTTEKNIIEAIEALDKNLTIIMIAHRLSTLKYCTTIYKLSKGKIIEKGSYEEVCG